MDTIIEVSILGSGDLLTELLHNKLVKEPDRFLCRLLREESLAQEPDIRPNRVALILPQDWEQLARWLPKLERTFSNYPWLIVSDLRVSGMFLSTLQKQACALLPLQASYEEVKTNLIKVAAYQAFSPINAILSHLNSFTGAHHGRQKSFDLPTLREMECGCAVALGLSIHQIGEALKIGETTVKTHIYDLMHKLDLSHKGELAEYLTRKLGS